MNRQRRAMFLIAPILAASLLVPALGLARTQHAIDGYPAAVAGTGCWDNAGAVMTNICSGSFGWIMPVDLDTAGSKTVQIIGQVLTGGSATCQLIAYTASGAQQTGFPVTFPAFSSTMGAVALTANVSAGSTLIAICSASGSGKVRLLGLDYTP